MIKGIIFDCFGVLTVDIWHEFLSHLDDDVRIQMRELMYLQDIGQLTRHEMITKMSQLTGKSGEVITKISAPKNDKNTYLLDYIKDLKYAGYKIGMLSNIGSNWVREEFLTMEEQQLFDDILLSYEVGLTKPDQRFYTLSCERLGLEPKQCVLVDDIENYCKGARTAGLQAVLYQNVEQVIGDLNITI